MNRLFATIKRKLTQPSTYVGLLTIAVAAQTKDWTTIVNQVLSLSTSPDTTVTIATIAAGAGLVATDA